jgi:hypothetical protein
MSSNDLSFKKTIISRGVAKLDGENKTRVCSTKTNKMQY